MRVLKKYERGRIRGTTIPKSLRKVGFFGVAVLTSSLALIGCKGLVIEGKKQQHSENKSSQKEQPIVGVDDHKKDRHTNDSKMKDLIIDAKYSPDKATRMKAVNSLSGDDWELFSIASEANYQDSRLTAVKLISDYTMLITIQLKTKCMDSRIAATNRINIIERLSKPDAIQRLNTEFQSKILGHIYSLAFASIFSDKPPHKEILYSILKKLKPGVDAERFYEAAIACFSPSKRIRLGIVKRFKREKSVFGLTEVAEHSEYRDTRLAATKALRDLNPSIVLRTGFFHDSSRFSQCKNRGD